jgi:hypothetical protein
MFKYLITIVALIAWMGCANHQPAQAPSMHWNYTSKYHSSQMDRLCQPLLETYQQVLRGLTNKDTSYVYSSTQQLIQLTDSLALLSISKDSNISKTWVDGLNNINAELQGVVAAKDPKELNMSVHMSSMQLLYFLSAIGYQANNIYVFSTVDKEFEDGLYWLSVQKQTKDPYHPENRNLLLAAQILQEAH